MIDAIEQLGVLLKSTARGGKYFRREPTGDPKRPYRYYYTEEQYRRAKKDEKPKTVQRHWVLASELGFRDTQQVNTKDGEYTTQRKQLHERIKSSFLDHVPSVPNNKKPVAVVMMGGPASGKGTVLRHLMGAAEDFVNVNPDDVKEKIPEYSRMMNMGRQNGSTVTAKDAALLVHEESSDVSDQLLNEAVESRKNVIVDGTGKNVKKHAAKIQRLKDQGYHVRLVMPHVDLDEARKRMKERADRSGRYVPEDVVDMAHHLIPGNFMDVADHAHEAVLFDNSKIPPRTVYSRDAEGKTVEHDEAFVSKFMELGKARHRIARERGWMKSHRNNLQKSELPPVLSLADMLRRMSENRGEAPDTATGLDDFKEETAAAMKAKKSMDAIDSLGEQLMKGGPRGGKYYRRVPSGNPKKPWKYFYTKEQYDRAHGHGAHINGGEILAARKAPASPHLVGKMTGDEPKEDTHMNEPVSSGMIRFYDLNALPVPDEMLPELLKEFMLETADYVLQEEQRVSGNLIAPEKDYFYEGLYEKVWAHVQQAAQYNENFKRCLSIHPIGLVYVEQCLREKGYAPVKSSNYAADRDASAAGYHHAGERRLSLSMDEISPVKSLRKAEQEMIRLETDTAPLKLQKSDLLVPQRSQDALQIIDSDCLLHGRDLAKSNFSDPYVRCTCSH